MPVLASIQRQAVTEEKELAFTQDYAKTDGIAALQEEANVQQSSTDSADLISDDEEDEINDVSQPTVLVREDSTASKRQSSVLSKDSVSEDESLLLQVLARPRRSQKRPKRFDDFELI